MNERERARVLVGEFLHERDTTRLSLTPCFYNPRSEARPWLRYT
jgi:hypothetical protein